MTRYTLISLVPLVLIASVASAQQRTGDQLRLIGNKLETLEKKQDAIRQRLEELGQNFERVEHKIGSAESSGTQVAAVAEIAKLTMESYESRFGWIQWVLVVASGLITLIFGGFAFFGVREFKSITGPLKDRVETAEKELKAAQGTYSALTDDLRKLSANVRGTLYVAMAGIDLLSYTVRPQELYLRRAARHLKSTIEDIKPPDTEILASAYRHNGFLLRRTSKVQEALGSVEKALELDPEAVAGWYNAACYAAVLGDKAKWVRYLEKAIAADASLRKTAPEDNDFKDVLTDPEFIRLTTIPA